MTKEEDERRWDFVFWLKKKKSKNEEMKRKGLLSEEWETPKETIYRVDPSYNPTGLVGQTDGLNGLRNEIQHPFSLAGQFSELNSF